MKNGKKKRQWLLGLAFGCCCGLFLIYCGLSEKRQDHTPPVLTVPEGPLTVTVEAGEDALLAGITARDDRDGDVTGLVVLESVSHLRKDGTAEAVYAAFDRAGNVAKAHRELVYTDYEPPRFTLSGPLVFAEGTGFDVFGRVGAVDAVDGDLSGHVKGLLVSGGTEVDRAGSYEVEFRVTNSLGDTAHLTLPVEVRSGGLPGEAPELTDYLLYLKKGAAFDPLACVAEGSRERTVVERSDVDPAQAGTYTVTYADRRGEAYGMTRLIVVVEE